LIAERQMDNSRQTVKRHIQTDKLQASGQKSI
jgi:hypothetical protein